MKKIFMLLALLLLTGSLVIAQTVQITGTVTSSEDGLPMPGVSVTVKGTTLGVLTDADGKYSISVPPEIQITSFQLRGIQNPGSTDRWKNKNRCRPGAGSGTD